MEKVIALLKDDEKYRQLAYDDATGEKAHAPKGKLTIGYGLNLEQRGLTEAEAEYLLKNEVADIDSRLQVLLPFYNRLDPVRQAVLIDMAFNTGVQGLMEFSNTLSFIDARKFNLAAQEMLNSDWAHEVGNRAIRLSNMMSSGNWPDFLR